MTWIQYDHADDLPPSHRRTAQFRASIEKTEQLLEVELEQLKAGRAQILTGHVDSDRTRTGRPSTDLRRLSVAMTSSVRVVVPDSKHGPLQWTASRFGNWTDNLRAIALTLENLRAINRYGATDGEQYRGFKALPAGDGGISARRTIIEAAGLDERLLDPDTLPAADLVRRAIRATHPDRHNGDRGCWDAVTNAARLLGVQV